MLKIIVCMKQVFDPEAPTSLFEIDVEAKSVIPPKGSPPVLNPYDENALEAALKIKDATEAQITVVTLGKKCAKPVFQKSLAVGADELFIIQDEAFEGADAFATASSLSRFIKNKIPDFDIIICGRQSSDTNAGLVGPMLAELLEVPGISLARNIEVEGDTIKLDKEVFNATEKIKSGMPALLTVGSEVGELRMATVKATMAARKKKVPTLSAADLEIEVADHVQIDLLDLQKTPDRGGDCEMIEADDPGTAGELLANRLKEKNIV